MTTRFNFLAATMTFVCLMPGGRVRASDPEPVLTLSALAVVPEDPAMAGRTTAGSVTIVIERWSTDPDLQQLGNTAPESLLAKLQSGTPRVGVIRRGSITVADLIYAREEVDRETKGRRIVIGTDRPLRSWNLSVQAGPVAAPELTLFDLHLTKFWNGEGRLVTQSNLSQMSTAINTDPLGPIGAPICLAAVSLDTRDVPARQ